MQEFLSKKLNKMPKNVFFIKNFNKSHPSNSLQTTYSV